MRVTIKLTGAKELSAKLMRAHPDFKKLVGNVLQNEGRQILSLAKSGKPSGAGIAEAVTQEQVTAPVAAPYGFWVSAGYLDEWAPYIHEGFGRHGRRTLESFKWLERVFDSSSQTARARIRGKVATLVKLVFAHAR